MHIEQTELYRVRQVSIRNRITMLEKDLARIKMDPDLPRMWQWGVSTYLSYEIEFLKTLLDRPLTV